MLTVSCLTRRGLPSAPATNVLRIAGHGVGDRPHDGVADEVGEADLAHPAAGAVAVDDLAVDLEQLGRDVAEARRRRHGEAALHVGGDRRAGATDGRARLLVRSRRLGRLARLLVATGRRRAGRLRRPAGLIGGDAGAASPALARARRRRWRPRPARRRRRGAGAEAVALSAGLVDCSRRRTPATPRRPTPGRPGTARTSLRPTRSWSRSPHPSTSSRSRDQGTGRAGARAGPRYAARRPARSGAGRAARGRR